MKQSFAAQELPERRAGFTVGPPGRDECGDSRALVDPHAQFLDLLLGHLDLDALDILSAVEPGQDVLETLLHLGQESNPPLGHQVGEDLRQLLEEHRPGLVIGAALRCGTKHPAHDRGRDEITLAFPGNRQITRFRQHPGHVLLERRLPPRPALDLGNPPLRRPFHGETRDQGIGSGRDHRGFAERGQHLLDVPQEPRGGPSTRTA